MELSINKCSVLSITLKRNILGAMLKRVTNHDYLGVTISSDLNWLRHVRNYFHKASRILGILKRTLSYYYYYYIMPILMLLYIMLYIVLAYLMLFAALTNPVCLNNASFFLSFIIFLCQGYELSGEIALKNNHYYYYLLSPCSQNVKSIAYKMLVRPQLEYASEIWNPYTMKCILKIEQILRNSCRFIFHEYRRDTDTSLLINCHH